MSLVNKNTQNDIVECYYFNNVIRRWKYDIVTVAGSR